MSGFGGRDSQRGKLYDAEEILFKHESNHTVTLAEAQQLVDKILSNKVLARKWKLDSMSIEVIPYRGRGGVAKLSNGWHGKRQIALGTFALTKQIVIHEVCHHLAGFENGHNWKFARTYLDVVRNQMGQDAERTLRKSMDFHKVKHNPPRKKRGPVSEEQRMELVARLAKAREAKAAKEAEAIPPSPLTRSVGGVPWTS